MHQSTLQQALCLLPFLPSVCIAQSGVALAKDSHADDQVVMLQTVAQGRVAGQEDMSKRSLLSDRLPSCTCEKGKDATCPCSNGCCRFETCYAGQDCSSTDASSATSVSASAPTSDCAVLQQTAVAAGCSPSLLQHTIPGGGVASKTAGAATSATTAAVSDTAGAATDTVGAASSATTAAVSDTAGAATETVGAASSATEAAGNAAVSASSSYASIQQTAVAAGCTLSLLQEVVAHNHSERALLNERLPSCECPGGKSSKCGCNVNGGVGCCQWETCYPNKACGPVPDSATSASGSTSGTAVADNTACCESLQQSAAAAGCSGPSLLQEQLPDDEEYENKKNDAKSKADAKKDDAKSNAENKKDDAKSKADTKKDEAEDKKDDAKSKAENKKDDAKSKAEDKKDSALDRR